MLARKRRQASGFIPAWSEAIDTIPVAMTRAK
jgi:hypothetical protein